MTTATAPALSDLKTQFYALMENYPTVYANYQVNPNLPSVMKDHDKIESGLTSLHRRMFTFQAGVENELGQYETTVNDLTSENVKLNTMLARKDASLDHKRAIMTTKTAVQESFVSGLGDQSPSSTPSPVKISLVAEAKSIEKSGYVHSIARIVYLLTGIVIISYFIFQTVGSPDSIILADAKIKAEQIKNDLTEKAQSIEINK